MRACLKCRQEKPLTEYYRHGRHPGGQVRYSGRCKDCVRAERHGLPAQKAISQGAVREFREEGARGPFVPASQTEPAYA